MGGITAIRFRGAIATKMAGMLLLCLSISGCHTVGSFEGWATIGVGELEQRVPECVIPAGSAVLCRDEANVLGLAISPVKGRGSLESWTAGQYQIQLRLRGPKALAKNTRLLLPLLHSSEFGSVELIEDASKGQAILSVNASAIGLDLFGATLMSPGGVQGVLIGTGGEVFQLDARLGRRNEAVGKVWLAKRRTHLLLESRVEYKTLWNVENTASQPAAHILLEPGEQRWVRICDRECGDPRRLRYRVFAVPTVPQLSFWLR
jgi:hypothetical protein